MKLVHVLICTGICYFAKNGDPETSTPWSSEREPSKEAIQLSDMPSSFIQETPTSYEENVTIATKPPKKKNKLKRGKKKRLRQVKVHPRGGRHIKDTFQNLRSVQYIVDDQPPSQVTTETVVTLEPIYDKSENSYSREELLKLCVETKSIGQKFGIRDVSSFAGSNCALIRLYYPDVTCEQINVFLQYCQSTGSIH